MGTSRHCLAAAAAALALVAACAAPSAEGRLPAMPRPPAAPTAPAAAPADGPGGALGRFVEALQGGRWAQASSLLSARWRAAYTAQRLAADYAGAGPVGREAAARIVVALAEGRPLEVRDGRAVLSLVSGQAVLVSEAGGWRVDALE